MPGGASSANPKAVAYYDRLIDGLLEAGIRPMATLFHWDTPEPLQEAGGWRERDTALRFAEFATMAGERFGDRVEWWVTDQRAAPPSPSTGMRWACMRPARPGCTTH